MRYFAIEYVLDVMGKNGATKKELNQFIRLMNKYFLNKKQIDELK